MTGLPHYPVHPNPGPHGAPQYYPPQPPYGYPMPYGPPQAPGLFPVPAGLVDPGSRLGARLLDLVIWFAGYVVTGVLPVNVWRANGGGGVADAMLFGWFVASFLFYFPFCVAEFGSTLGKSICGMRVVHRDTGRNIGFGRALVREISWPVFSLVPVLGLLNSLWCCWDRPYRQCLHDKLPDTVVVDR